MYIEGDKKPIPYPPTSRAAGGQRREMGHSELAERALLAANGITMAVPAN